MARGRPGAVRGAERRSGGDGVLPLGAVRRAALEVGFGRLELPEIVSFTTAGNRRSRAVMERIGLRDTHQDFDYPGFPEGHALRRHCLYRITREEWSLAAQSGFGPTTSQR